MTRARVTFKEDGKNLCAVYIHADGYIENGLGYELSELFGDYKIVNGLGMDNNKVANGMGCLAALFVACKKDGPGYCYIQSPEEDEYTRPSIDYHYFLTEKDTQLWVEVFVFEDKEPAYAGWLKDLKNFEEE